MATVEDRVRWVCYTAHWEVQENETGKISSWEKEIGNMRRRFVCDMGGNLLNEESE